MGRVSILTMKISIVIPVLNPRIEDVKQALACCAAQTKPPFEVIFADGGSANIDQIKKTIAGCPNVILLQGIGGLTRSLSRREGMLASSGDYLVFLDCDDVLSPFFCETVDHLCDKSQPDLILFGNISNRNWSRPNYDLALTLMRQKDIQTYFLRFDRTYEKGEVRSIWAKAFKTSFLKSNNLPDTSELIDGEDQTMMYRVSFLAKSLISLPSFPSYSYQIHPYSVSIAYNENIIKSFQILTSCLCSSLLEFKASPEKWQEYYYLLSCEYLVRLLTGHFCHPKNSKTKRDRFVEAKKFFFRNGPFKEAIQKCSLGECPTMKKKIMLLELKMHIFKPIFNYYERKGRNS
jgi:glycosyltransferase involved in cell wall biosynthesis